MKVHFQRDSKGMFRFILSILFILAIPIILSSLLSCRVSVQGEPYGSGPAHFSRMEGLWFFNANNQTGKLEFYGIRNGWAGRIWFDTGGRWIEMMDIFLDSHTGQLQFRVENQIFYGTLSGNRIVGTFGFGGAGGFPWEAWRQ
jgi:hypothetical protein